MLRQNSKILTISAWLADALMVILAFFAAWIVKFLLPISPAEHHLPFAVYLYVLYCALPAFSVFQYIFGLYQSMRTMSVFRETVQVLKSALALFVSIMSMLFIFKIYDISRLFITYFCILSFLSVAAERLFLRYCLRSFRKKGFNIKYVVLLGLTPQGKSYISAIQRHSEMGYRVFGILDSALPEGTIYRGIKLLGGIEKLPLILDKNYIDEVVIAIPMEQYPQMGRILEACEKAGVKSVIIPGYSDYVPSKPQVDELDNIPLINTRHIPLDNLLWAFVKRSVDLLASLLFLLVLSPVFLVCAAGVKLSSPGPVIFRQERVGYNKKPFLMYKFRTMRTGTSTNGWTVENDPRRTAFGSFLRRTSLDELPQLYNVLKGDMSLIGPRPEQKNFVEQFKDTIPKYMVKHRVRPGMTGWAQVNGLRGDTSIEDRIKYDIYYIENWSLFLDFKIALMTLGLGSKNAY